MAATAEQVQQWSNERTRVRCEQIRKLYLLCKDDVATFGEVYEHLTNSPTWTDQRSDAPPNLLTPNDLLAVNTFIVGLVSLVEGTFADVGSANAAAAQYPIVQQACVRAPEL